MTQTLNNPRLAIVTGASPGGFPNVDLSWAEVISDSPVAPTILIDSNALSFTTVQGTSPANQVIALSNIGAGTLDWTATANATAPAWLSVAPAGGSGNATLTVSVNSAGLAPGTYTKTISVSAPGATNTPQAVNVTLDVTPAPFIGLGPSALSFTAVQGTNPADRTIALSNSGGGTLSWTATSDATAPAWLSVGPASGTGNGTLTASVNTAGLVPGTYTKTITISAAGATNTPQTVNATLTVNSAGTARYDFTYPDRAGFIAAGWNFIAKTPSGVMRNTERTTGAVVSYDQAAHPGTLRIPVDSGDMWGSQNNTRNSLFRSLSSNWTSIKLKLSFAPTQNYQQAGLLAYQDDDNYVQVTRIYGGGNKVTFAREINGNPSALNSATETATANLILRLDRDPSTQIISAYYSKDGSSWTAMGSVTQALNNPQLAVFVGASPGGFPNADLSWAEVITENPVPSTVLLSTDALSFTTAQGTDPLDRTIALSNSGGGAMNWTAVANAPFVVSPASGTGNATLTVSVNSAGLVAGTYTGAITIAAEGATNSPQTVNATLTVNPVTFTPSGHYDFTCADRESLLAAGWSFLAVPPSGGTRNTEQATGAVVSYDQTAHPGILRIPVDVGDLWAGQNNTRNTLLRNLPPDWTSIRLKLSFAPTQNYQQAGLLAYQDDDNYVQVTRIYGEGNAVTFAREINGGPEVLNSVKENTTGNLYLRLDRDPSTQSISASYSRDGSSWLALGSIKQTINNPKLAIFAGASPGGFPNADLSWAEVYTLPPAIALNPAGLRFSGVEGTPPASQTIALSNRGGGTMKWTATADATAPAWLSVSPASGTDNATLTVSVNSAGLSPGTYTKTITVSAPRASNTPRTVNVTLTVNTKSNIVFAVNSAGVQYTSQSGVVYQADTNYSGGYKASTTAAITGTSDVTLYQSERYGNFSYNIPLSNGNYIVTLKFAEMYWNGPGYRVFNVSMQGIQVISNLDIYDKVGKDAAYDVLIPVSVASGTLNINFTSVSDYAKVNAIEITQSQATPPPPAIALDHTGLSFSAVAGTNPANQTIALSNSGGGTLNWTAAADGTTPAWLSVSPANGTGDAQITVSVNIAGLAAGTYTKAITITANGATNSPQTVNVTLTVNPVTTTHPSGHYDFNYPDRASLLAAGWDFLAVKPGGGSRNTEQTTGAVVSYDQTAHTGILRIPADAGDMWGSQNNTRNTLLRSLPADWTSIRLKLSFAPTQNYQQAGLLAYQDDNNYVNLTRIFGGGNTVTFAREINGYPGVLNSVPETATGNLYLRLDRDLETQSISAYYSKDGSSWITMGSVTQNLTNPKLAIFVGASPGGFPNADLSWAEVIAGP